MARKRHRPWRAFAATVERAVLGAMIAVAVAVVGRRLRKRFR